MKKILRAALLAAYVIAGAAAAAAVDFTPAVKLQMTQKIIEAYYVDSIPEQEMVDKAIVAMLGALDPHSSYSDAKETKELTEPLKGNFSGIGIQFKMQSDTLYVVETIAGGPSERVGIKAGDRILSANDTLISGVKKANADVIKLLRGPKGTKVNLKVLRRGVKEPIVFRVTRDDIPLYSVDAAFMAAPGVGYIKVSRFAESTPEEFLKAMEELSRQGMSDLIIDLEDNGGGYLQSAASLAEMFLRRGQPIVSTRGQRSHDATFEAQRDGLFGQGRVVVMVNQYSASASEILAGAIQDNDRGVIVGRRTFGKGLVQRPFPMPDGSMIRLTIARYYTPSGRCIQKPYEMGDEDTYRNDIVERYKAGEFSSADSIHFADSLRYSTLRLKRPVYGGGGIMPDVFVAIDTTGYTPYWRELVAKGVINSYCLDYVDAHRTAIKKKYATAEAFLNGFEIGDDMTDGLIAAARREGIEDNPEQFATSAGQIKVVMKSLLLSDIYGRENYYRSSQTINPVFLRALEILTIPGEYEKILGT